MIREAPVFGMGPGTFALAFPYYTSGLESDIPGFWDHLHQLVAMLQRYAILRLT